MHNVKVFNKNRLINEKSPYLLQHAYNPVDWYPWGEEAFSSAATQDKPVFLSIGYSTCHWCHVMAEESFEDLFIAELINDAFIPVKVDREERPDIDNIYMAVCQMMTGLGGWPLTIIMTPEKKPFFSATYIPKRNRYGKIGLSELIPEIKKLWQNNREELIDNADKVIELLNEEESIESFLSDSIPVNKKIIADAVMELKTNFDDIYGGYGNAPKFPIPHQEIFLLNYYTQTRDEEALEMVEKSLLHMRAGGIYDHIGSGFHRYSTDRSWLVPHFEKMLYDQALLLYLYTAAYQITKKDIYKSTIIELVEYLKTKLSSVEGGFYSAEDADSEGEEGKYYLWDLEEIKDILRENADEVIDLYNINSKGNFYDERTEKRTGKNILHLKQNQNLMEDLKKENELYFIRNALYQAREKRIQPGKDDKILTDWNGLLIAALARASFVLGENEYLKMAEKGANFIINHLKRDEFLLHRYCKGETAVEGLLDDYAFFIWGLIELYQASFKIEYIYQALGLNDYLLKKFWDEKKGGFFYTSCDDKELILRRKEIYDGALPSGNSIMLWNLIRLSHLTGNHNLEEKAELLVNAFYQKAKRNPSAYTQFLVGLQAVLYQYYDLIIIGNNDDKELIKILDFLKNNYINNLSLLLIPPDERSNNYREFAKRVNYINNYKQVEDKVTIYFCEDYTCKLPVTDADELLRILKRNIL